MLLLLDLYTRVSMDLYERLSVYHIAQRIINSESSGVSWSHIVGLLGVIYGT